MKNIYHELLKFALENQKEINDMIVNRFAILDNESSDKSDIENNIITNSKYAIVEYEDNKPAFLHVISSLGVIVTLKFNKDNCFCYLIGTASQIYNNPVILINKSDTNNVVELYPCVDKAGRPFNIVTADGSDSVALRPKEFGEFLERYTEELITEEEGLPAVDEVEVNPLISTLNILNVMSMIDDEITKIKLKAVEDLKENMSLSRIIYWNNILSRINVNLSDVVARINTTAGLSNRHDILDVMDENYRILRNKLEMELNTDPSVEDDKRIKALVKELNQHLVQANKWKA